VTPRRLGLRALALATVVGGVMWWRRPAPPAAPAAEASAPAVDPALRERQILRDEVRRLGLENAELRAEKARVAAADGGVAPTSTGAEIPRPTTPLQSARWLMARAAFLDGVLARQPRDEAWASALENKTRTLYAAKPEADGVKLVSVSCRSTACRLEFTYADADARLRGIQRLGQEVDDLPRVTYAYPGEPDVHTRAIFYMAQDAHPLPALDYAEFAAANP
jgi:hypothetical protein